MPLTVARRQRGAIRTRYEASLNDDESSRIETIRKRTRETRYELTKRALRELASREENKNA